MGEENDSSFYVRSAVMQERQEVTRELHYYRKIAILLGQMHRRKRIISAEAPGGRPDKKRSTQHHEQRQTNHRSSARQVVEGGGKQNREPDDGRENIARRHRAMGESSDHIGCRRK